MRFLADAGISPNTIDCLRRNGHDAVHVRNLAIQRAIVVFGKDTAFDAALALAIAKRIFEI